MAATTWSGPSARTAAASSNALSAPPLKATSTEPRSRRSLLEGGEADGRGGARRARPGTREVVEHDVGAGREQLLAGAAAGEHRDADGAGSQGAFDVVDVVADVDRGALAAQHVGLADAPDLALEVVDVERRGGRGAAGVAG